MNQTSNIKTQIENFISQKLKHLYLNYLEQDLHEISFHWLDNRLVIVVEGTVTLPERILYQHDRKNLAYQIREAIDELVLPQVKETLEERMEVKVTDFLSDTTIQTGRTGVIAIFEWSYPISS